MLHLTLPMNWQPERCWIVDVVLRQFLGLEYSLTSQHSEKVCISAAGKTLTLSDAFFASGMPLESSPQKWDFAAVPFDTKLCMPNIPVLFGRPSFDVDATGNAVLSLDVFGSSFFMLTRYEETVGEIFDRHGRFPAEASLAVRLGFLDRPIVDEYVEILWGAMKYLWPTLERKQNMGRKLISCDVDLPFDPACSSISRLGKRLLGRAYRERSLTALAATVGSYFAVQRGNQSRDPYWQSLFWIMHINERAGNQVTFNFIPEPTDAIRDNAPSLEDQRMRHLLRAIHERGHLIGIHPGYNTYRDPYLFAHSVAMLRRILDQERIFQHELGGRQHYLRWDVNTTPQLWGQNALSYDSTLSYATVAGFRTGTCHEYTMYDIKERRALTVKQRPLIVMEHAVIDEANMGLGHTQKALAEMERYKKICNQFRGDFTLLWHNSSFENKVDQTIYSNLIQ